MDTRDGVGEGALFFHWGCGPSRSLEEGSLTAGEGECMVDREKAGILLKALIASGDSIIVNLRDTQTSSSKVSSSSTTSSKSGTSIDEVLDAKDNR